MSRILRFPITGLLGLLAFLVMTLPARAGVPFRPVRVRIFPVTPIPNVNSKTVFVNPFSGRAAIYVPPSGDAKFATIWRFGSPHRPIYYPTPFGGYPIMGGGYGMGNSYGSSQPIPYPVPYPVPQTTASAPAAPGSSPLDALELPHVGNQLLWPLGLRIVPPALETQPLLQQTEAQILALATEAANGQVNAERGRQAQESIRRLRQFLKEGETKMARPTAAEARQFLELMETTLQQLAKEGNDDHQP